jgi:hypothetical protein
VPSSSPQKRQPCLQQRKALFKELQGNNCYIACPLVIEKHGQCFSVDFRCRPKKDSGKASRFHGQKRTLELRYSKSRVRRDRCIWISFQVETLAKKYDAKYKSTGETASRFQQEEALFKELQDKKLELFNAVAALEAGADPSMRVQVRRVNQRFREGF